MNWLDVILIIVNIVVIFGGIAVTVYCIKDSFSDFVGILGLMTLVIFLILLFTFIIPFVVLDRGMGNTIGTITSVDKNFFGTTAVYIKTSETEQEKYCIEDKELASQVAELIGKKVKVNYGTRVGLYSTGKCHQAPIEKIEEVSDE